MFDRRLSLIGVARPYAPVTQTITSPKVGCYYEIYSNVNVPRVPYLYVWMETEQGVLFGTGAAGGRVTHNS